MVSYLTSRFFRLDQHSPIDPDQNPSPVPAGSSENPAEVDQAVQRLLKADPWEEIGFHRPLGSFWYSLSISIFSAAVSLFFVSIIYKFLYPYPEMEGYNRVASMLFSVIYTAFDIGTAFGIERFIAENRIKDPKKMLEYIRFFIWYQMFTGLIQVVILSIWVFQYIRFDPALSYTMWLMLICLQKQWPGMLGTFSATLKGLQKYNKTNILNFIGGSVFQNITNVTFILLGRWWGQQNPIFGDLMGGAIGFAIGGYVDDFFTMAVAGHFLDKELRMLGYRLRDAITPSVSKEIIKQCLWFGLQASAVPMLNIFSETIILLLFLKNLPQYTTWVTLKSFASGLAGIVNVGNFESVSSISEAYGNGKQQLTKFYISYALKWNTFLKCFLMMTLLGVFPIIVKVITTMEGLENYQAAVVFIPFLLVEQIFFAFIEISDPILVGTLRIGFYTFVRLMEEIIRVLILFLLLEVWHIGLMGPIGVVLTLGYDRFYARLIKMVTALVYINRKIFKVEIYWMSTIIIPLIAALPVLGVALLLTNFVATWIIPYIGLLPTAALSLIVGVLILPIIGFLPLVGFLGAFDDFQLQTFKKSVELSGPSKPIIRAFYRVVEWGHNHCPWKNRFQIPWEIATLQMRELLILKAQHKLHIKEK